ncbi:MAG TPA: sigma-70 family RNA polymerase sigma factor [Planctomycetota bacterium]
MSVEDPADLVERARKGSAPAFSQIVRLYQSRVRAFIGRWVRDASVVEDLAQDTFVRAYRALPNYRGESSLAVWLLGIARNLALMHLRDESRRRAKESDVLQLALSRWLTPALETDPDHDRALSALEACVDSLPDHSAELVQAHYFQGRGVAEMARASGKKESALGMTLLRIREILRRCVRARLAGSEANA